MKSIYVFRQKASEASNTKPINLAELWLEIFSLPKLIAKIFGAVSEIKIL